MWLTLDSSTYQRFHDVIISSKNGTSQIDHILVSQYGVFIVETKNLKGWIFGSEGNAKWTQSLYGKKYQFQNPLRQAYRQRKILSEFLEVDESIINTVVLFVGDCKFKTKMPPNVIRSGIGSYVKKHKLIVLSPDKVGEITSTLSRHIAGSGLTKNDHIKSLRQRHNSSSICPKCGSTLVVRKARKGKNTGSTFIGCSGYPKCRYTKSA